jgi:hypothetical protein
MKPRDGEQSTGQGDRFMLLVSTVGYGVLLGVIYLVLMITLGIMTLRKGHWVMFIIGLIFPILWLVGAVMPARRA